MTGFLPFAVSAGSHNIISFYLFRLMTKAQVVWIPSVHSDSKTWKRESDFLFTVILNM